MPSQYKLTRGPLFSHLSDQQETEDIKVFNEFACSNEASKDHSGVYGDFDHANSKGAIEIYLKEISLFPMLTREEETQYALLAQNGDAAARDKIISSNLRLVARIARRYLRSGLQYLDLIEEGNLGLLHALEKFDTDKGFRFSTYSVWWVQQYIERAIMNQSRIVRLPIHIIKELNKCLRACRELKMDPTQNPSLKKIASHLQKDIKDVESIMSLQDAAVSYDSPHIDNADKSFIDFIGHDTLDNPLISLLEEDQYDQFLSTLNALSPRELEVTVRRYGLMGHNPMTLQETGDDLGLTRERVRQIQSVAVSRLVTAFKNRNQN